jgi:hypothetical protein
MHGNQAGNRDKSTDNQAVSNVAEGRWEGECILSTNQPKLVGKLDMHGIVNIAANSNGLLYSLYLNVFLRHQVETNHIRAI